MSQNRRDFLLTTLKTAGAAAVLTQLQTEGLMAIPPARVPPPLLPHDSERVKDDGDWLWDGTAEDYLKRLNALVVDRMRQRRTPFLELVGKPMRLGQRTASVMMTHQANGTFSIPSWWRTCTVVGIGEQIDPDRLVMFGLAAQPVEADPVANIENLAEGFARRLTEAFAAGARVFCPLEIPLGLMLSAQQGMFRLVMDYEMSVDRQLLRLDVALATPQA